MARDLAVFVVPDVRLARVAGLDPEAAGLRPAATPRHASVLLLVGDLPEGLARAAAVAYAQMPRPRAILAAGGGRSTFLPAPDVAVALDQAALAAGVRRLRGLIAEGAFSPEAIALESAANRTRTAYVCPMHPEIVREDPGSCPICGMDLVPREATGAMAGHDHAGMSTGQVAVPAEGGEAPAYTCPMHPEIVREETGRCPICGMNLVPSLAGGDAAASGSAGHEDHDAAAPGEAADRGAGPEPRPASAGAAHAHRGGAPAVGPVDQGGRMDHAAMGSDAMDHGMMDPAGFMSMVAMTKDLPRSGDGLPMEWVDAPFGPLFPGLPAGLALTLTLDGDTVARATVAPGAVRRDLEASWPGPVATFPARLSRLDPLAPVAYRILARRALEAAARVAIDEPTARARVGALERERAAGHLGWLAQLATLLGAQALARRAAGLQAALLGATSPDSVVRLRPAVRALAAGAERPPLMRRRLSGIGAFGRAAPEAVWGPVARSVGLTGDERGVEPVYEALGFVPAVEEAGDALARLRVRLTEIVRSVDLLVAAGAVAAVEPPLPPEPSGTGAATIETPRGAAVLHVELDRGRLTAAHLDNRARHHAGLVPIVAEGAELADALVGVASLDLSPWEIDR